MRAPFDPNVNAYTHSLTSSVPFPDRLHLTLFPPYPGATNSQSLHPTTFLDSFIEYQKPNFRDAVSKLNSDLDSPRLAGFVVDMFCTAMIDVAAEFRIPPIVFYASGAAFLGLLLHIHMTREREEVDTTAFNFKDSSSEFDILSWENPVPAIVFPGVMLDKGVVAMFFGASQQDKERKGHNSKYI